MITDWDDQDILASRADAPRFYHAPHPPGTEPRLYQHAGVEYSLIRDNSMIGDAPGVGKTAQGVLISNAIEAKRTLVVCPASLRLNWEREIWNWSMIENVSTYVIGAARDGVSLESDYVITSYDLLRNDHLLGALLSARWDHLIIDEAHYLKDPKGNRRTQAICAPDGLSSVVGRITLLTGTPMPNQPIEVYNAARLLNWDCIDRMSLESFRNHYYAEGEGFVTGPYLTQDKKGNVVRKVGPHWSSRVRNVPRRTAELRWRLRKNIMVRRLKIDVLKELPPRQWQPIPLDLTAKMRKVVKHPGWREAESLFELDPEGFAQSIPIDGSVSEAKRLLGEAKVPGAVAYIKELLLEGRGKLVVGAWHLNVLAELREALAEFGVAYMDGHTSARNKQAAVDQFQEDPEYRIILGQMIPLGEGWNLTAAQDVILPEPYWVPGKNDQLLDRCHRLGQEGESVTGHLLIAPLTLDEQVISMVIEKDRHIYSSLDGDH